jgi:catechol 2,3-dioxygenase-like lactoylglutathione lyase family enzyme
MSRNGGDRDPMTSDSSIIWAPLVPELLVADIDKSLRFWRDLCGFAVVFDRLYEGFAYLDRDGAQIMLEERGRNRNWITGSLETPFGRGVNFQISVSAIEPILAALARADWRLFMEPEQKWYRTREVETGLHQFLVQDPDGYLIRFSAHIGERPGSGGQP